MDEFAAVKARLEDAPQLTTKVFETARVDSSNGLIRDTYLILFGGGPESINDYRLAKNQDPDSDAEYEFDLRAVSTTAAGARALWRIAHRQLVGHILTVDGRRCDPLRFEDSEPVQPDNSVKPPLFYIDSTYSLTSRRG